MTIELFPGGGTNGGGPPASPSVPYIFVPYQNSSIQVITSSQYVTWTTSDTLRPPTAANGSTLIPGTSASPTTIFSVPAAPSFSKINIELVIEPVLYSSPLPFAMLFIQKNGSALAYEGISLPSKRLYSAGDDARGEIWNLRNINVDANDYFQLYASITTPGIQFRGVSQSNLNATNLMYCRVEEVS